MARNDAKRRAQQTKLFKKYELTYLGNGPSATGGHGWTMGPGFCFKCTECGYFMNADPTTPDGCFCGRMYKDPVAGRFRLWDLGDDAVEVYRATRRRRWPRPWLRRESGG